jgi:hypothetical protein
MAKRKSKKLTIEEIQKEILNEDVSKGKEETPLPKLKVKPNKGQFVKKSVYDAVKTEVAPEPDDEITDVDFEETPVLEPEKPAGIITLQDIGDRMRVIRAKKRSSDPKVQAEGTKELKDLNDELHEQEKKMKSFFGR